MNNVKRLSEARQIMNNEQQTMSDGTVIAN